MDKDFCPPQNEILFCGGSAFSGGCCIFFPAAGILEKSGGCALKKVSQGEKEAGENGMDRDVRQKFSEWKNRNGKKLTVWISFLIAGALLMVCGAAGCSESRRQQHQNGAKQEEKESAQNMAGNRLLGGSSQKVTYEVRFLEKEYEADDGTAIFRLKLSWPVLLGSEGGIDEINAFFEKWAQEKIREYEADENSTRQSALEVYRESRGVGWAGPWGEEYRVSSVGVCAGYASILMDSYLYEGSVHKMPYREDYAFDLSDGHRIGLTEMSAQTQEEWEKLLRKKFLEKLSREDGYYADAREIVEKFDFAKAGWYFTDAGIAFYLPPYTIAPYDAGYVEVIVPFEEARIK